jgi:tight adherence protein C
VDVLPLLLAAGAGAVVLLAVAGVGLLTEPGVEDRFETVRERRARRRRETRPDLKTLLGRAVDRLGRGLAPTVLGLLGDARLEEVDALLDAAGRPDDLTRHGYAARKGAYTVLLGLAGIPFALQGAWFVPLAFAVLGFLLPDIALKSEASERQEEIQRQLPDFLDVLAVTVSAGLDFRAALGRVADAFEGPLSDEVRTALQQMLLGESRRAALDALRRRNRSESLSEFVTALQQAEDLGAPMTEALDAIAEDVRRSYAQEARREAAKVEPRLSVIMTLTLIPAALILIAVGFFTTTDASLGGMLGGF